MQIDEDKLNDFVVKFVQELGAVVHAPTVIIGDKLGLYKAMAGAGPLTSTELAAKTNTAERYIREWLATQAASGYVCYDGHAGKYSLSPEQAFALADESSPAYLCPVRITLRPPCSGMRLKSLTHSGLVMASDGMNTIQICFAAPKSFSGLGISRP